LGGVAPAAINGVVNLYGQVNDALVSVGATSLTLSDTSAFVVDDYVLVVQMQDALTAGTWEPNSIVSINGNVITLGVPLTNSYTSGKGAQATQVVKVARYKSDVTINSGSVVTAQPWNGSTGGIVALRVEGNLRVAG
jgi:hypothetical protein